MVGVDKNMFCKLVHSTFPIKYDSIRAQVPGFAFSQWSSYQDDSDDDFFDGYDSRRTDREITNRNRV
jgi:hypothetical protein